MRPARRILINCILYTTVTLIVILGVSSLECTAQSADKKAAITAIVESIHTDSGYIVKQRLNEYFVDVKNESPDGGQELKGYYKSGVLKRIEYGVGVSFCNRVINYYFMDTSLIFVQAQQFVFPVEIDSTGEFEGFNYYDTFMGYQVRHYFWEQKLIATTEYGIERFPDDSSKRDYAYFQEDVTRFKVDLLNADTLIVDNNEDRILSLILDLPEVRAQDKLVRKLSKGTRHLQVAIFQLPKDYDGVNYWVKVWEDNGFNYVTHFNYEVSKDGLQIKKKD